MHCDCCNGLLTLWCTGITSRRLTVLSNLSNLQLSVVSIWRCLWISGDLIEMIASTVHTPAYPKTHSTDVKHRPVDSRWGCDWGSFSLLRMTLLHLLRRILFVPIIRYHSKSDGRLRLQRMRIRWFGMRDLSLGKHSRHLGRLPLCLCYLHDVN